MAGLKLLKPFFKKYLLMITAGFLALILCDLAQLAIPTILGRGIDLLSMEGTIPADLWNPVSHILFLAVGVALMRFTWRNCIIGFSRRVEKGLRDKLYEKVVRLSPGWHLENASGDMMAMATNDIDSIRMAISAGMISLVDTTVMGCAAIGFMLSISPTMTLWALLPMPAISLVTHFLGRRLYSQNLAVQDVFGKLTETVREQLSGVRVIRAMGLGHLAMAETEAAGQLYQKKNIEMAKLAGTFFPFLHFMSNLAVTLVLYFGGRETILGHVSTGDFVAFINYLAMLTWPLMALGMIIGFIQQGLASLDRINRVMAAEDHEASLQAGAAPPAPVVDIKINNLTFKYPSRQTPALDRVTMTLKHNELTALVGPMGSGKSTLAAIIAGIYAPPEGTVKISGQPAEDWPVRTLRGLFGYVPQDGFLFNGTLYDNLAFGRPDAPESEVMQAAEVAGFAADIAGFPDGLKTLVGERGLTLSGGQRQRLAMARALVINPAYLILDDTLSAVDAAVEAGIMERLLKLRHGRGGLIISHRLTSLMGVDKVLVMEKGHITEEGTPAELMRKESYFKRVHELSQFEAEKERGNG